jgi:hypothetical protein
LNVITNALVARYVPPTPGQRVLQLWDPAGAGKAVLDGGGFAGTTNKPFTVATNNKVTVTLPNAEALKLTFTPATGFFSGTVIPTGATTPKTVYGVLLQGGPANGGGLGFFLNGTLPGKIQLLAP